MSIRFRVTTAASGKKYGAIVNTFRDKKSGKVLTRSLKSYGVVSPEDLNNHEFLKYIEEEVKQFKLQNDEPNGLEKEDFRNLIIESKGTDFSTLAHAMPQYFYALLLYRKIWESLSLDEVLNKACKKSKDLSLKLYGELICFYICALSHFEPNYNFLSLQNDEEHLFDLSILNLRTYDTALKFLAQYKDKIVKTFNDKNNLTKTKNEEFSFYLTKFYFIANKTQLTTNPQEIPMIFGQLLNSKKVPLDYALWSLPKSRSELFEWLRHFEAKYAYLKENNKLTVISDTELNNKRSLIALSKLGYNYILIRNLYKLSHRIQKMILSQGNWQTVYNKQGQSLYKYKEFSLLLSSRDRLNLDAQPDRVNSRIIVIWSDSKRVHDLDRLAKQWEVANAIVHSQERSGVNAFWDDESEEIAHGMMQFVRKKEDLAAYELDLDAYKNYGITAGFYIIATSLKDPVHDIYRRVRSLWRDKEVFRSIKSSTENDYTQAMFIHMLQGQFCIKHIAFLLERSFIALLKSKGLNVSSKQLRDILHECMLVKFVDKKSKEKLFIKTSFAGPFNKALREGRQMRFDEIATILNIPLLHAVESFDDLKQKFNVNLPYAPAL